MKIVAMGDSITEGYPYTQKESWVTYIDRKLECEVMNKGINGNLTRNMAERFERDVLAFNPSHVIILGGTNDAYAQYSLELVTRNFSAMVTMCQEQGIISILGLPIPILVPEEESFLSQYRNWVNEFAVSNGLPRIDFYSPFQKRIEAGMDFELYMDEVHPNIEGYKVMGETALKDLRAYLK